MVNLDLAVEDLHERLRAGKIYAPRQGAAGARAASSSEENLSTLRELALREVAESLERASAPAQTRGRGPSAQAARGAA